MSHSHTAVVSDDKLFHILATFVLKKTLSNLTSTSRFRQSVSYLSYGRADAVSFSA